MNVNKIFLAGNLTRDPELSYLPGQAQTAVCSFGMAVNRKWTGQDGQSREDVLFIDCTAFGKTGEVMAKHLKKGRPVFIEGRLKLDQWEKDGQKRSKHQVIVDAFQFVGAPPENAEMRDPRTVESGYRKEAARTAPKAYANAGKEDDRPPVRDDDIPF